ncbi:MAG: BatD family protein [Desulfobulbaceae bacterium]|nr:BatD family protein [Desulfobulbaceae bacterium]
MKSKKISLILFLTFCVCLFLTLPVNAADVSVQIVVTQREASVGEPLSMQLQVNGANSADEPDLSHLDSFHVQPRGGQSTSSTQVTNINGNWERITNLGYIFNYTITPMKPGELVIPPIPVTVEGKTYKTRPVTIQVHKPRETEDFKLRTFLSSNTCFVGEPIIMTTTWFVGKDVTNFEFQLPVLADSRFDLLPLKMEQGSGPPQDEIKVPVGDDVLIAMKGTGELGGKEFLTVTFQHLLVPREPGTFTIPQSTVACQTVSGYRKSRRRNPFSGFGGFDDFFGSGREALYRTLVIPSSEPPLNVIPLPEKNKPSNFSGLVGDYSISSTADPVDVAIGDPITLTVTIKGPLAAKAELPGLADFLPESSFKIPEEISPGEVQQGQKTFTQTIRIKNENIHEIPSLQLVYFDPNKKEYKSAKTEAIPVSVAAARVVTAQDAVGAAASPAKTKLEEAEKGLAFNYEGKDVLINQKNALSANGSWFLYVLFIPPMLFFLLAAFSWYAKYRQKDPAGRRAQKALETLERSLAGPSLSAEAISAALKEYLGAKLQINPGALTFQDVAPLLQDRGVDQQPLTELQQLLELFETWQYGGQHKEDSNLQTFKEQTREIAGKLEACLS